MTTTHSHIPLDLPSFCKYDLPKAVSIIQLIEPLLSNIGYHSALTGSVLYKGKSLKDIDIIIYPHDPEKTIAFPKILNMLTNHGFTIRYITDKEYVNRPVALMGFDDLRIDLFYM